MPYKKTGQPPGRPRKHPLPAPKQTAPVVAAPAPAEKSEPVRAGRARKRRRSMTGIPHFEAGAPRVIRRGSRRKRGSDSLIHMHSNAPG